MAAALMSNTPTHAREIVSGAQEEPPKPPAWEQDENGIYFAHFSWQFLNTIGDLKRPFEHLVYGHTQDVLITHVLVLRQDEKDVFKLRYPDGDYEAPLRVDEYGDIRFILPAKGPFRKSDHPLEKASDMEDNWLTEEGCILSDVDREVVRPNLEARIPRELLVSNEEKSTKPKTRAFPTPSKKDDENDIIRVCTETTRRYYANGIDGCVPKRYAIEHLVLEVCADTGICLHAEPIFSIASMLDIPVAKKSE